MTSIAPPTATPTNHRTPSVVLDDVTVAFGGVLALDHLSFQALPGRVTGFLGPNGAGKSTALRVLLGLVRPQSGRAVLGGQTPLQIGALLGTHQFHPGRSGRNHLRMRAPIVGVDDDRVDVVLELVDLAQAADRRVGGWSLGMRQRLGLAEALLGHPSVLLLDEPANGLDPAGIRWLRSTLRQQADAGLTVVVSSHVLAEVEAVADDLVLIDRGRLVTQASTAELLAANPGRTLEDVFLDLTTDA